MIDLVKSDEMCDLKLPFERWGAVGGTLKGEVVVCGGKSKEGGRHQNCNVITKTNSSELIMLEKRYGASSININESMLWITGTYTIFLEKN